jgi:hypothetical protein
MANKQDGNAAKGGRPPKKAPPGFPANLRKAREAKGLSVDDCVAQLSKQLKRVVIADKWRSWERGERLPDLEEGLVACELLGADPYQIGLGRKRN